MPWLLRGLVLLAATMPVFAAAAVHPVWWQVFIAAAIGSALGQLAVRFTRGRRIAQWAVIAVAVAVVGATVAWSFRRGSSDAPHGKSYVVVRWRPLTWEDVEAMRALPSAHLVVPYLSKNMQTASEDANWNTSVVGTTSGLFELLNLRLARGTGLVPDDSKIVVLGDTVVKQLYGGKDALGETIRINNLPYTVVGVLAHRGMSPEGHDDDDLILMPVDTFNRKVDYQGKLIRGTIVVLPALDGDTAHVEEDIRSLLRDRHHLTDDPGDELVVRTIQR